MRRWRHSELAPVMWHYNGPKTKTSDAENEVNERGWLSLSQVSQFCLCFLHYTIHYSRIGLTWEIWAPCLRKVSKHWAGKMHLLMIVEIEDSISQLIEFKQTIMNGRGLLVLMGGWVDGSMGWDGKGCDEMGGCLAGGIVDGWMDWRRDIRTNGRSPDWLNKKMDRQGGRRTKEEKITGRGRREKEVM